jgi:Icc-related predicted phosphoesterase
MIPDNVDVLIAHNPAMGYVDGAEKGALRNLLGLDLGGGGKGCPSSTLMVAAKQPRLYACGHVHSARGVVSGSGSCGATTFANGANVLGDHGGGSHLYQGSNRGGNVNWGTDVAHITYTLNGGALVVHI